VKKEGTWANLNSRMSAERGVSFNALATAEMSTSATGMVSQDQCIEDGAEWSDHRISHRLSRVQTLGRNAVPLIATVRQADLASSMCGNKVEGRRFHL